MMYPSSSQTNQRSRDLEDDLICEPSKNFYVCLCQVIFLLALLGIIIWLTYRSREPTFTVLGFSIPTSNDTSLIDVKDDADAITYSLETENPNEESGIYYDDIVLAFYYEQDAIGDDTINGFYQGHANSRQVNNKIHAKNSQAWKALRKAIMSKAKVLVNVTLSTKFRYKNWAHKSGEYHGINFKGSLPIGPDGKISGKKKKIKLRRSSKKRR